MNRTPSLLALLALVIATTLAYRPALAADFVWLDHREIVEGALIVNSPDEALGLFLDDHNYPGYQRPLYNIAHSLDHLAWGLDPFGFHLSSLLLHLLAVLLAYRLVRSLAWSRTSALSLAALFALHPICTSVAGLVHSKADLLVTVALLASTLFVRSALRKPRPGRWIAAGVAFLLALMAKETAYVFPIALTLACHSSAPWQHPGNRRRLIPFALYAWGACLCLAIPRLGSQPDLQVPGLLERMLTFCTVYLDDLRVLLVPTDLRIADTVTRFYAQGPLVQFAALSGTFLVLVGMISLARRIPGTRPWIVVFHLSLLPVCQLIPILHFRADRFLYLPCLCAIAVFIETWRRFPWGPLKRIGAPLILLVCAWMVAAVHGRTQEFQDDLTLFSAELARTPDYLEGHASLAAFLDRAGRYPEAEVHHRTALARTPERISFLQDGVVAVNLSFNLIRQGRPAEARTLLLEAEDAIQDPRQLAAARFNRGVAAILSGLPSPAAGKPSEHGHTLLLEGAALMDAALVSDPDEAQAWLLLGRAARALSREKQAENAFRRYLELKPEALEAEELRAWMTGR